MLQSSRDNKNFEELIDTALKRIKSNGYQEVRSVAKGYDSPVHFKMKNSKVEFIPDISAENQRGQFYFEISQRTEDVSHLVSKWKLLSTMAKIKNGSFTILIPYGQNRFTEDIVNNYDIDAKLVKLN